MDSDELKYAVMQYWRFKRQALYIATEVGAYSTNISDVLLVCGNKVVEVETKVSASDFMADFKKRKHKIYELGLHSQNMPNFLYYAIPEELSIDEGVFEKYPKYGLIRIKKGDGFIYGIDAYDIRFVRKAADLYEQKNKGIQKALIERVQKAIFKRMASEVINVRRRMLVNKGQP